MTALSLTDTIRWTELLLGWALLLASLEHLWLARRHADQAALGLFALRLVLAALLLAGLVAPFACLGLLILGVILLSRFDGPYNGGSDRMGLLVLTCLTLVHGLALAGAPQWQPLIVGYLALQLVLSYAISGWVKIKNPDWRSGAALRDVFRFSAYPLSQATRRWADRPVLLAIMAWAVMVFELLFPLSLVSSDWLLIALILAALFHLANAWLFGLNRFFWVWLAAYPALIWFQGRFVGL